MTSLPQKVPVECPIDIGSFYANRDRNWFSIVDELNGPLVVPGILIRTKELHIISQKFYYLVPDENKRVVGGWNSDFFSNNQLFLVLPGACERRSGTTHQIQLPVLREEKRVVLWIDNRDLLQSYLNLPTLFDKLSPRQ